MLAASFRPEVVEEKASENVKRLSHVRETARVVSLEVWGVVFLFEDNFPEKDEGPGDGEMVGRLPFLPRATESIPSYGQKKGRESNWQFNSRPLKVGNRPFSDLRIESAICRWKDLNKGYKFGSDLIAIRPGSREL